MKFLFSFFFLFTLFSSNAQQAILRRNTVYVQDEAAFQIFSTGTITHHAYKIKNMQDEDLILVDQSPLRNNQGTLLMKFIFFKMPDAEAYIPVNVNFKKQLARLLVNYNVIQNGKLHTEGVQIFCKNYNISNYPSKYIASESKETVNTIQEAPVESKIAEPENEQQPEKQIVEIKRPENSESNIAKKEEEIILIHQEPEKEEEPYVEAPVEVTTANPDLEYDYPIVVRDITKQIYLSGSKIRQDYKEIGSYAEQKIILQEKESTEVTIHAYNGKIVARARFINGDEQCELQTLKDNNLMNIAIPNVDIFGIVKEIVKVLCDKMYL